MILAICPNCHSQLKVLETFANQRVKCPQCQTIFVIVSVPTVPTPIPPAVPSNQVEPISQPLAPSAMLIESSPLSFSNLGGGEEEFTRRRRRSDSREEDRADAPGVISLIFGCLAMLCALFAMLWLFGFLPTGVIAYVAYVAVPFASIGGLVGFYGKGNMRVAGLLLNFLALIPAIIVTIRMIDSVIAVREYEAREREQERQERARLLAQSRKTEAEARSRQAEAERLRQQAALKEKEARLLEQKREEARQKAEREREQEELRIRIEQRHRDAEARRKAEQEAKEEAEREAARKADLEKKGLPYYPRPRTSEDGHNAEEWYQLLRENPLNARIYRQATAALLALKSEGIPYLLDYLNRQKTPKDRHVVLQLIKIEYVHVSDLLKILSCLDRDKNLPSTRLLALQYLEKRAKDVGKALVPQIELLVDDMLDNPRYKEETKEEITSRLKTIRREATSQAADHQR